MRTLVCKIDLFTINQEIDIYEGQRNVANEIVHTATIKEDLPRIVKQYSVDRVNLYGMKDFAIALKDAVENSPLEYNKKVEVRIMK